MCGDGIRCKIYDGNFVCLDGRYGDDDLDGAEMSAIISKCGQYRYSLRRRTKIENSKVMCFVMLNPSTADAEKDDATIRRCIGFAEREGCGVLQVVNLFAYRSTDPEKLGYVLDPVGPENSAHIEDAVANADIVVVAWGSNEHAKEIAQEFSRYGSLHCLGKTKNGSPRHPLYVKGDQPLEVWL
jgi:hypothetical protein